MKLLCKILGCRFYRKAFLTGDRTYVDHCVRCRRPMNQGEKIVFSLAIFRGIHGTDR